MLKICLVKQHSCYDLYTKTGPDLRSIVESSNWRSGPIGLWEAFDCDAKIVYESADHECQIGKKYWEQYVQGWEVWPEGSVAEYAENIDWSIYDVVVSIDIAVPTRVVKKFRDVMWCYYFVEGGPKAVDTFFRGSPFHGYNVFLNHRFAKNRLTPASEAVQSILRERRAVLDFPYYLQSAHSIHNLYPEFVDVKRSGMILSHHSYDVISKEEKAALYQLGGIQQGYKTISDIHKLELLSKYYIVHPNCKKSAGLGLIEAISAGCLALAPRNSLWGFPDLINDNIDYKDFDALLGLLHRLENDKEFYEQERKRQANKVEEWCFTNPVSNLEFLFRSFKEATCSSTRQAWGEKQALVKAKIAKTAMAVNRRSNLLIEKITHKL